jgi:hypothetical protein
VCLFRLHGITERLVRGMVTFRRQRKELFEAEDSSSCSKRDGFILPKGLELSESDSLGTRNF